MCICGCSKCSWKPLLRLSDVLATPGDKSRNLVMHIMPRDVGSMPPSATDVSEYLLNWQGMKIPGEAGPTPPQQQPCLILMLFVPTIPSRCCVCAVTREFFDQVRAGDLFLAEGNLEPSDGSRLPVSFTSVLMSDPVDHESELTNTFAIAGRWHLNG